VRLQSDDTLRALIKQRGLNQSRVAAAAGCAPTMINKLCLGVKTSCSDSLAYRIAECLSVPVGVLFVPTESTDQGRIVQRSSVLLVVA
jgi:transcriptional regulator with XRE-family HTH domain